MDKQKECIDCGISLPENGVDGLCPACLLKQGLASGDTMGQTVPSEAPFGDEDAGIVVDGSSSGEVAEGLARLLRLSASERRSMGARGRALALSRHTPAAAGDRYHELLLQAASS